MRHFRRHANALSQRGVRMDRLADVHGVGAHLDGQRNLANQVAVQNLHTLGPKHRLIGDKGFVAGRHPMFVEFFIQ